MLDVPMPEDDDMSDDDFDGYLSDDSDIGQDDTPENSSGEAATAQAVDNPFLILNSPLAVQKTWKEPHLSSFLNR